MDTTRTPKRKRRRLESGASRRGSKKTSSSSSSANLQIVWKDSPADKQIKVSGTGKMAVRREMQGFVGRLARASQQSPPPSSEEEKKPSRERVRTRRKVAQHEEEKAASRHLMFSPPEIGATGQRTPNTARRRRSTERGDSQDELFNVLDQMEQKYASPDVALPLTDSRALLLGNHSSITAASIICSSFCFDRRREHDADSSCELFVDWDAVATLTTDTGSR
ncbi:hypothetical protein GQ600_7351 [Phytophthora cactorum]|nr:hypothetical protein GQ600_7351 [Phytophthora cactorum]